MTGLDSIDLELPVGSIVAAEVGGEPMAVIRTPAGWVMTPDRCPHGNCPFTEDGELDEDGTLICNCHGSEFDAATGKLRLGPAVRDLTVTRLEMRSSHLIPTPILAPDAPGIG